MENPTLKIEIVTTPNSEVSFCSERGGIITSLQLHGKEILYFDKETFLNTKENVRGGIPILVPNAGLIESKKFPNLKRHGFVRESHLWNFEKTSDGFRETLLSNEEDRKIYPYDFELIVEGKFEENRSFSLHQSVKNLEKEKELPIAMGLHPYFKVPKNEKNNIRFNFEGGKFIEERIEEWANGNYISVDNPKIKDPMVKMEVVIPHLGTLIIDASPEYRKIWIWSLPEKDFFCVEPVMRDVNGLADEPEMIKPGETFSAHVNFQLQ